MSTDVVADQVRPSERWPILFELPTSGGMMVDRGHPAEELVQRSAQAVRSAMGTVEQMVQEINATVDRLVKKPDELELSFGLKFDLEGNAMVAKVGAEAAIGIKITWTRL